MDRLTVTALEHLRINAATATMPAEQYADINRLLAEVETLISEKADARRKLDTVFEFLAEFETRGVHEVSTELIRALLAPTREALIDNGE